MKGKQKIWIVGAVGCSAVLTGGCLFSAVLFFVFIESSPSSIDEPDLWYSIPGQLYVAQSRDCQAPWEEVHGANAKRCQRLVNPPSIAEGVSTGVIVHYQGSSRRVESVQLVLAPYSPQGPDAVDQSEVDGFDFARTIEHHIDLNGCKSPYSEYLNSGMRVCDDFAFGYAASIRSDPAQPSQARLWVGRSPDDFNESFLLFARNEHREVAQIQMQRGSRALQQEEFAAADEHFSFAFFLLEQIPQGHRTSDDIELQALVAQSRLAIVETADNQRRHLGNPPPRHGFYGLLHLPTVLNRDLDTLTALLGYPIRCEWSTDALTSCAFGDQNWWVVGVEFDGDYSARTEVVFPAFDLPLHKDSLHYLELPIRDPDHRDSSSMRWDDIAGLNFVEFRYYEEHDLTVIEAGRH